MEDFRSSQGNVRFGAFELRKDAMHESAIAALQKAVQLSAGSTLALAALGEAYAAAGDRDEAERNLDQLQRLSKQQYVTPYFLARVYAAMGDRDDALSWLETAYRDRAPFVAFLKIDPQLDNLRPDPRSQDLLRRMNFP